MAGRPLYDVCVFLREVQLRVGLGNTEAMADRSDGGLWFCPIQSRIEPELSALLLKPGSSPLLVCSAHISGKVAERKKLASTFCSYCPTQCRESLSGGASAFVSIAASCARDSGLGERPEVWSATAAGPQPASSGTSSCVRAVRTVLKARSARSPFSKLEQRRCSVAGARD
jgi:hypothetical protein